MRPQQLLAIFASFFACRTFFAGRTLIAGVALALAFLIATPSAMATAKPADAQASKKQLSELKTKMQKLQGRLNDARGEQGKLQAQLGKTEKKIGSLLQDIRRLEADLTQSRQRLKDFEQREAALQTQLAQQKQYLAQQLRAAHSLGQDHALKMLLNLESLEQAGRMMTYYEYFNQARSERIHSYLALLEDLKQTREAIVKENEVLVASKQELDQQQAALLEEKKTQAATLAKLNKEIKSGESELKRMAEDQKRLEKLVKEVERAVADIQMPMPQGEAAGKRSFRQMRAKLSWPIRGKLLKQFSSKPDADGIKWNGIFIESSAGTSVKAVHPGRVVFADWLRGFGLLVIIDHGQGYMSLYGSNQAVYKQPGDWVGAGETIAGAGSSGGQPQSGLYFEVRHKGEPDNPLNWLAK